MLEGNNFQVYSIALYGRENVEESCLRLQDEYGLDVNVVLFCYWFGAHHGVVGKGLWKRIDEISRTCQSLAIQPLRGFRRDLRSSSQFADSLSNEQRENAYKRLKTTEIRAELVQQRFMQEACADFETGAIAEPAEAARRNAEALLQRRGITPNKEIRELLAVISLAASR